MNVNSLQVLSDQVSSGLGLYAELEAERASNASLHEIIATLEQRLVNHEALEQAMDLQTQRLKEDVVAEQDMNKKLAEQLQQAAEVCGLPKYCFSVPSRSSSSMCCRPLNNCRVPCCIMYGSVP